jgi:hypothetical protein
MNIHTLYSNPEDEGSMYLQMLTKLPTSTQWKHPRAELPSISLTPIQAEDKNEISAYGDTVQLLNVVL